jgi:hypothetical protein
MLIGNRERFAFELVPVSPGWERRYAPEAEAWAGLAVWASGKNLCAHVRAGEEGIRQHLFVPLGPVADWFVRALPGLAFEERAPLWSDGGRLHDAVRQWGERRPPAGTSEDDWLDAREAFWSRHFLAAGAEGARLPNLALLRQDDEAVLVWAPPRFAAEAGAEWIHSSGTATVAWADVESSIRSFVEHVAGTFRAGGRVDAFPWLSVPAADLLRHAGGEAVGLYCAHSPLVIAALFGVGAEQWTDALRLAPDSDPSTSPVCQTLRDLPPTPTRGIAEEILSTVDAAATATERGRTRWLGMREHTEDCASAGATPQQQGRLAAQGLRNALGLDAAPIAELSEVAGAIGTGIRSTGFEAESERMLVAAARGGAPVVSVLRTRRTATPWGHRFELARGLGHALLDPLSGDALGAASSPFAQQRRRMRSGAFAAELLLPAAALERASGGHLDGARSVEVFSRVMKDYAVGARTAAHQLFNHGWLSSPAVRDELIDEHAA